MYGFLEDFFYLTNTTVGLALMTSIAYFSAGLRKKGLVIYLLIS